MSASRSESVSPVFECVCSVVAAAAGGGTL